MQFILALQFCVTHLYNMQLVRWDIYKIVRVQITENSGSWLYHEKILKHRHIPSELLIYFLRTQALVIATNLILVNI